MLKNSRKLATATQLKKKKPTLNGALCWNQWPRATVTGLLTVDYGDSQFNLHMSIKINYRDGRPYHQFPAIFAHVLIKGVAPKARMSEKWLSENFK